MVPEGRVALQLGANSWGRSVKLVEQDHQELLLEHQQVCPARHLRLLLTEDGFLRELADTGSEQCASPSMIHTTRVPPGIEKPRSDRAFSLAREFRGDDLPNSSSKAKRAASAEELDSMVFRPRASLILQRHIEGWLFHGALGEPEHRTW